MNHQWKIVRNKIAKGVCILAAVACTSLYACENKSNGSTTDSDANDTEMTDTTGLGNSNSDNTGTESAPDTTNSGMTTDTVGQRAGDNN
jgi:hypothetical protein